MHVLEVEQAISALPGSTLLNVFQELVVLGVAIANHLHVDLLLIADIEDDITMLLVLFDFFVGCFADV